MEHFSHKIYNLAIETENSKHVKSKCFSSKPVKEKDKKLGKIFGFISMQSEDAKIPDFINFIIDQIKINYYSFAKENEDAVSEYNIEEALEGALQKTNIDIFAFLEKEKISILLQDIHILIAAIKNHGISFSAAGNIHGYLFHFKKNSIYQIINVYENIASADNLNPLKFFTQTISGQIANMDSMFFCTSNILDYLSLDKIKTIITQNEAPDCARFLKTILSQVSTPKHFIFSIISVQKNIVAEKPLSTIYNFDYAKAASRDSIKKLAHTEKTTERFLNPSLRMTVKRFARTLQSNVYDYFKNLKDGTLSKIIFKQKKDQQSFKTENPAYAQKTYTKRIRISLRAIQENKIFQWVLFAIKRFFKTFFKKFVELPLKTKTIAIISIMLTALFIQSIYHLAITNKYKKEEQQFETALNDIKKLRDAAEASIIYQDEDAARNLYIKANNSFENIPKKYTDDPKSLEEKGKIQEKLRELRHIENIEDPIVLGNWKNLDPKASISPTLIYANSTLYSQNLSNSQIYTLDVNTHIIGSVYASATFLSEVRSSTLLKNEALFLNNKQTLFSFNILNGNIKPIPIRLDGGSKIIAMENYNNKIYLLDAKNNTIIKFTYSSAGLSNPENWIRDDIVDITDGVDLAIDGNIYVLKNNGEVIKLLNGKLTTFSVKSIDPALEHPTKIFTTPQSAYLYILDPPNKRIVLLDKNGKLVRQYFSEKFTSLKNFIVSEKEKKIYVLDGNMISGFSIK